MISPEMVLRQCRLLGHAEAVDIAIQEGTIQAIAPRLEVLAAQELSVQGKLVSPPFVESHIHLDSALTVGEPRWNQSGTLFEGIDIWRERKQSITLEDVKQRATTTLKLLAQQGTLFVRSHADVSEPSLTALKALLEVRDAVKDWITVQVVAFPQDGIYGSPGNDALIETAMEMGADVVGGIPHYELTREDGVHSV
jgi:cytosine/creatinine deaminase